MRNVAYVVMGVSGCGKSTVGQALAEQLGLTFHDGDDLHPTSNISKMAQGDPLTDADRHPWLLAVAQALKPGMVVACSALRKSYRDLLRDNASSPVMFVYLRGQRATLIRRMSHREGHFMPVHLLDSQIDTLEEPSSAENCVVVDIEDTTQNIVGLILSELAGQ